MFKPTLFAVGMLTTLSVASFAAELSVITPDSEPRIFGKECDWIYGDYLMANDQISLVIAAPLASRDANMTTRNVGGSILDLTLNSPSNDQLSAYIPTAGRFLFREPDKVEIRREKDAVVWQCGSSRSPADSASSATVKYRLADADVFVEATVSIEGDIVTEFVPFDGVRADGWFKFEQAAASAYCVDEFFRQTIGFRVPSSEKPPSWKRGRPWQLRYSEEHVELQPKRLSWTVQIFPATSPMDLLAVTQSADALPAMHTFRVLPATEAPDGFASVNRARIVVRSAEQDINADGEELQTLQSDDEGLAHARIRPGAYTALASVLGCKPVKVEFTANERATSVNIPLQAASGFRAEITDGDLQPIPAKVTIYSNDGEHPKFGLSAATTFVENCVYAVHGRVHCPLDPGTYEIYFSRGPEFNSVSRELVVVAGQMSQVKVQLDRVVSSTGWVSADLHSHSSPSGDNTSAQYGRVENLLCEHIEFAPCTEHNRVNSYSPHLAQMKLSHLMATCTGIELTGSPTPVNHQNAFPLQWRRRSQNGGGPRASYNPVVQIERLAMWDKKSDKLVQMNHPDLHRIYGDADQDGKSDAGYRGMLQWTDVVEVHPLENIFSENLEAAPNSRRKRIAILQWLQLLNQGHRIPGVINTDSHYNHHGSGWRRNWFASGTDDPAEISVDEMVRESKLDIL